MPVWCGSSYTQSQNQMTGHQRAQVLEYIAFLAAMHHGLDRAREISSAASIGADGQKIMHATVDAFEKQIANAKQKTK